MASSCVGGSASCTATGGTSPYTYSWTPSGKTGRTVTGLAAGFHTALVIDGNGCSASATINVTSITPVTSTTTATNVSCNGTPNGQAKVNPINGTPGYTFRWNTTPVQQTSNTATSLAAPCNSMPSRPHGEATSYSSNPGSARRLVARRLLALSWRCSNPFRQKTKFVNR